MTETSPLNPMDPFVPSAQLVKRDDQDSSKHAPIIQTHRPLHSRATSLGITVPSSHSLLDLYNESIQSQKESDDRQHSLLRMQGKQQIHRTRPVSAHGSPRMTHNNAKRKGHPLWLHLPNTTSNTASNSINNSPFLETDIALNHISLPSSRRASISSHRSSKPLASTTATFEIRGMTCVACVQSIDSHLLSIPGIVQVNIALLAERAEITFVAQHVTKEQICEEIESIGFEAQVLENNTNSTQVQLHIDGMTCGACVHAIEQGVSALDGVKKVNVQLALNSASIEFDSNLVGIRDLIECIESLGFEAQERDSIDQNTLLESLSKEKEIQEWRFAFLTSVSFALPHMFMMLLGNVDAVKCLLEVSVLSSSLQVKNLVELGLASAVQWSTGRKFYQRFNLRHMTMDVLVVFGTCSAYFYSLAVLLYALFSGTKPLVTFFETSSMLIVFVALGRWLESLAKGQTTRALSSLLSLRPAEANLFENNTVKVIPVHWLKRLDLILIRPGDAIPADGLVQSGQSLVNESLVTGEAMPVHKSVNDSVLAGTVNQGNGVLTVQVNRLGQETALSRIVQRVTEAQSSKAPIQALADKVAGIFVPIILILGALTFFVWLAYLHHYQLVNQHLPPFIMQGNVFSGALQFAIAVMVIACPCALGLATPTAVMVGTGILARRGILVKGASILEQAAQINAIVFDKTGTLTRGQLRVANVFNQTLPHLNESALWWSIKLLEEQSDHPIAKALVDYAKSKVTQFKESMQMISVETLIGKGLSGKILYQGREMSLLIGNESFMNQHLIPMSATMKSFSQDCSAKGETVIYVAVQQQLCQLVSLSDEIRPETLATIDTLKRQGYALWMMSGDKKETCLSLAQQCGIPSENVFAEVTPAGKAEHIKELQEQSYKVLMVGDGVNDAPALAQSNCGVALSQGSDVAMQTADMVLMRNQLDLLITALFWSKKIVSRIRMNFIWASAYNFCMVPLAAGCLAPVLGWTLHPMIASSCMALSSVSVVISSLLLEWEKESSISIPFTASTDSFTVDLTLATTPSTPFTNPNPTSQSLLSPLQTFPRPKLSFWQKFFTSHRPYVPIMEDAFTILDEEESL